MAPPPTEGGPRVLCVEDDPEIARLLTEQLAVGGFRPRAVASGAEMDAVLARDPVDLVLLDVMLPGEDGISICRRLRAVSGIPIVMVTARGDEIDRILGLEIGADDYVAKPFNPRELMARIRALMRRTAGGPVPAGPRKLGFAGWVLDPVGRELRDPAGRRIALTSVELDLLTVFCRHAGRVLSREALIELTHGGTSMPIERSIDVHISRIRQKIEADPRDPDFIKTVRLGGYVFTRPVEPAG